ncbi:MAG: hypothetical protein AB8F94_02260 [Saprospiraceae bacterium]
MKNLFILIIIFLSASLFGQSQKKIKKRTDPIVAEGKMLFKSEMASWYGTDLFLENYTEKQNIGGYFSYTKNDTSKCIFFSRTEVPMVIGDISFDSTYNIKTAKLDLEKRKFSDLENDYFEIRKLALEAASSDTLFKTYKNTNLNFIPIINEGKKKVYVLTGPTQNGVVIFGNDYLISFNDKNEVIEKKELHRNIIPMYYGQEEEGEKAVGGMHSHSEETGEFITATDICTLMLYGKYTSWETHNVVSKKYLSIWDCKKNTLAVIPRMVLDKINKEEEKAKKKKRRKKRWRKNKKD